MEPRWRYPDGEAALQFAIDACVPDETRIYGAPGCFLHSNFKPSNRTVILNRIFQF